MYIYIVCIYIYIYLIDIHSIYYIFTYQFFFILSRKKLACSVYLFYSRIRTKRNVLRLHPLDGASILLHLMQAESKLLRRSHTKWKNCRGLESHLKTSDIADILQKKLKQKTQQQKQKKQFQANFFMPPCPKSSNSYA